MSEGKAVSGQSKTILSKGIELPLALGINDQTRGNHRRKGTLESGLSPFQSLGPTGSVSGVENLLLLQTVELEGPGGFALCHKGNEGRLRPYLKLSNSFRLQTGKLFAVKLHIKSCVNPAPSYFLSLGVCVSLSPHTEPGAVMSNVLLSASWADRFRACSQE